MITYQIWYLNGKNVTRIRETELAIYYERLFREGKYVGPKRRIIKKN